jgi:hypothetical protein
MQYLLVRHGVRDYPHWRGLFDADAEGQRGAGMHVLHILRGRSEPDVVVFRNEDRARAEAYMGRPGGEEIAETAGVQPPFEMHWLED